MTSTLLRLTDVSRTPGQSVQLAEGYKVTVDDETGVVIEEHPESIVTIGVDWRPACNIADAIDNDEEVIVSYEGWQVLG